MCGLAGLFLPRTVPVVEADIAAMLAVMRHRGPDGAGRHVSDDRRFQAGFTRLAIIDLATGDQPLVRNGGETVLLGNGEVYNYRKLRSELSIRGHVFRTQGDMEAALECFIARGRGFVHDLNGMYAMALYERSSHRLLLIRDRLGVKPLYWAKAAGGGIVFASEIKALFASGLIAPRIDQDAVATFLAHGYVPAPATLYGGVFKLPPASILSVESDGTIAVERYWRPAPAAGLPTDEAGIRAHLVEILDDAVGLQLRSDVPVGAMLSGGLDSGLLVALAAGRLDRPLKTYTVRFLGAGVDETPLAAAVAQRYGTDHTVFELETGSAAQLLPRLAWHADEPLADASLLPNHLINQVIGRETRVVLNGTGGDELFAGYGRYFRLPVEARWLRLPRPLRRLAESLVGTVNPFLAWQLARAEKFDTDRGGYLHDHSTLFPPPVRALLGGSLPGAAPAQSRFFAEFAGPADSGALYAELQTYLPEDLLCLLDRTTMAHSVEGRVPLLDHRLVEAALAVPPAIRTPGGRQKALERAIAADYLPEALLSAPKQGFASPVPAWFAQGGLTPLARRLLTRKETLERGWWSRDGIERLLRDPGRHAFRLYALLALELTVRLHVEGSHAEAPAFGLAEMADG
ncbi:asparagine synthase (glutamine-hydrolyzing) [Magnetospirillum sp. SS-4]|uniref:asparagine synthase (glutamine-hydrolyzing) n=1 Tax=Magnetospirillum sp. SS-4 TaxID=2681465 RepID=UPI0013865426|nr:asparagine synthase (glutamine-hydrolyzing) [Magnetospirillum sp. SS-4]CAA7620908.1 Asparagine synthetase [Magnetospirillum sp. SS-4]